ncbi:ubiquitin-conjugating enzyme E2Q-like protein 1 [Branchiostoma floridae]|uniref:Ubiquitin-conjugating enzyme E2Q-like protein 1 n=3 Tax=Branchiostoma floridae TaxID=7739 RepID=A0A9J7MTQ4_BRAFL|nr:ubiquitin-conjugating enzyme E2Q-like protein 1 [Branchiostoma floridae]XP_035679521.1 ubiquitin-conjugating enzyme E2Q-like protein 1 [Branchiostoma floridae]
MAAILRRLLRSKNHHGERGRDKNKNIRLSASVDCAMGSGGGTGAGKDAGVGGGGGGGVPGVPPVTRDANGNNNSRILAAGLEQADAENGNVGGGVNANVVGPNKNMRAKSLDRGTSADYNANRRASTGRVPPLDNVKMPTREHALQVRSRRLMRELQEVRKHKDGVFEVDLVEDNLYEWNVKLYKVDPDSEFYQDMQEVGTEFVLLNLTFPENFPFSPPFMRVLTPKIENGYVMDGGAICMELLTPKGWSSAYTVEAIILQFSASLVKGRGRINRKTKKKDTYTRSHAEASFRNVVKTHEKYGWVTPPAGDG